MPRPQELVVVEAASRALRRRVLVHTLAAAVDDADAFLDTQCDRACLKGKNMCTATGSSEAGGAYSVTIVYRNSSGQSERMNRSKFFGTWTAAGESAGAAAGGGP